MYIYIYIYTYIYIYIYTYTAVVHLVPEARIEQVQHGMLCTSYIHVDRHPVFLDLGINGLAGVLRVEESQIIPACVRSFVCCVGVINTCIHGVYKYAHRYVHMYIIYACIYIHIYIHIYIYICIHTHTYVSVYIYI